MVSKRFVGEWPQYVWYVTGDGEPLEAKLSNFEQGVYHGYPLQRNDKFRDVVLKRWNEI
jgi:hypothetical protein